ncbi:MAG: hypothetical protein F6K07_33320 [Okeania sp. SIO1H5]|uniref:hypothetical protein n=1 Tax=Okeania sp. SIO1H5 TaxID=2607777 RepID=UPI0013BBDF00|nr:hypothetical protein [Okeania sp. SIO1H5]NET23868.1 hypothetical protein [Okeania sp. SIO1H5]
MISDLHLLKFLQGKLSEKESQALIEQMKQSPELKQRLRNLQAQSVSVRRPLWQRVLFEKKTVDHRVFRVTIIFPSLVLVAFVTLLALHWIARPGSNSTLTYLRGNSESIELLYESKEGWRYFNAGFNLKDSLTIAIQDSISYHCALYLIRSNPYQVLPVWKHDELLSQKNTMPRFQLPQEVVSMKRTDRLLLVHSPHPLPHLSEEQVRAVQERELDNLEDLSFQFMLYAL